MTKEMKKTVIDKLKNMSFVVGLREPLCSALEPKRHLIIEIRLDLFKEKDAIELYDLLNSQYFFDWTIKTIEQ